MAFDERVPAREHSISCIRCPLDRENQSSETSRENEGDPIMMVVVFRARIREDRREEYYRRAAEMAEIACNMPGFISYKGYHSDDGERVSIHEWESPESLRAWREHPEHKRMQRYGRDNFYEDYTLYVCEEPRESRFERG